MSKAALKAANILCDMGYFGGESVLSLAKAIDQAADERYRPLVEAIEEALKPCMDAGYARAVEANLREALRKVRT